MHHQQKRSARSVFCATTAVLALLFAGCSGDSSTNETASATETPVETPVPTATAAEAPAPTEAPTTAPTPADPTATPETPEETLGVPTQEMLDELLADSDGGVAVVWTDNGVTTALASGDANAAGEALEPDTPMRAGSISKTFVATMVLQLVGEGTVQLDETLGTYLTDTPVGADVTVRQLLSHRSGIPSYTDQPDFFPAIMADPSFWYSSADIVSLIADVEADPADVAFFYSNTNYILLGQLLEAIDGTDINTSLQNRIALPLGISQTYFADEATVTQPDLAAGWSAGFAAAGQPDKDYRSMVSSAWAAGAVVSTTGDLATFMEALLGGELMSDALLTEMKDVGPEGFGLGLMQLSLDDGGEAFGHGGLIPGYTSLMAHSPKEQRTLVILANNDGINLQRIAQGLILN